MKRTHAVVPLKRATVVVAGVTIDSLLPSIYVKLRNPNKNRRGGFKLFCRSLNVGLECMDMIEGWFICTGGPNQLMELVSVARSDFVEDWHHPENKNVQRGSGAGEAPDKPKPTKRKAKPQGNFPRWWPEYVVERHAADSNA